MTPVRLKQFSSRRGAESSIFDSLDTLVSGLQIVDAAGALVYGTTTGDDGDRFPIWQGEDVVGWVAGDARGEAVARLLGRLLADEAVNAHLADEVLGLYREINLLYKLSEKLNVSLDPDAVMEIALAEARRMIRATSGAVILPTGSNEQYVIRTFVGSDLDPDSRFVRGVGLVGHLLQSEKGEIVNEVASDPRNVPADGTFSALIAAPLTTRQGLKGLLLLVNRAAAATYSAADLKLLTAVASQAAPAIEMALLHQRTLREAHEREEQLRRSIDELRIELDEARQEQKVAELVETEYFQHLRRQSSDLRKIMDGGT